MAIEIDDDGFAIDKHVLLQFASTLDYTIPMTSLKRWLTHFKPKIVLFFFLLVKTKNCACKQGDVLGSFPYLISG